MPDTNEPSFLLLIHSAEWMMSGSEEGGASAGDGDEENGEEGGEGDKVGSG